MSTARSLTVIMPRVHGQHWACHSCAYCCRELVVSLSRDERDRIDREGWASKFGVQPYVKIGKKWALNKAPDGACVFLDPENRCRIHSELGEAFKPLDCRRFPFSFRPTEQGWLVAPRFDCPSMARSEGLPVAKLGSQVRSLLPTDEMSQTLSQDTSKLSAGLIATQPECDMIYDHFTRWLDRADQPMHQRLIGLARITTTLAQASFEQVRGARIKDLLEVLFTTLPEISAEPVESPTKRQRGMLRQLTFAHAEHVSLNVMSQGWLVRLFQRLDQVMSARRFLRGQGQVPLLPRTIGLTTFQEVEQVAPSAEDRDGAEDLVRRYLLTRLESRSVFGAGYFGWQIFDGLTALSLSLVVTGWLARHRAACEHRTTLKYDDIIEALGVVDAAATRLPALGTTAERMRIHYLRQDDGIARLIEAYRF